MPFQLTLEVHMHFHLARFPAGCEGYFRMRANVLGWHICIAEPIKIKRVFRKKHRKDGILKFSEDMRPLWNEGLNHGD